MSETRTKKTLKNIIYTTVIKVVTFALGLVIPRLVIGGYGSEVNGLLQTVSNIYSYLSLIVAGVSTAAIQGLYKPLVENDKQGISSVLVAAKRYFRRLLVWYGVGVALLCFVFPIVIESNINKFSVFAIILLEGISFFVTYFFASAIQTLLSADGKDYVTQWVTFGIFLLSSVAKILLIYLGADIVVLQFAYLLINVIRILIYIIYVKRVYPWINWHAEPNFEVFSNRKHFLLNGVAWTVFNSTDTIIITIFCGLVYSSIYGIYNMVFANLNLILAVLYSSMYFVLGQVYNENREKYIKLHDGLESAISGVVFALLSVAYVLILPFLRIYTAGISDVNYIDPYLPMLFCLVQLLSNIRLFSGNLINISNNPKLTNRASIIEVIINIAVSIVLTNFIGLHGVLIGTIVALAFKSNFIIVISNKKILGRSPLRTYLTIGMNFFLFFAVAVITCFVDLRIDSIPKFLMCGIILCLIVIPIFILANWACNPEMIKVFRYINKKNSN